MTAADPLPTLSGERLRLRRMQAADAPEVLGCWGDPGVMRFMARPPLATVGEAEEFIAGIARMAAAGELLQWGIETDESEGRVVGTVTLVLTDPRHQTAEIGFVVTRSRWRRGIAGRAVPPALGHAFDTLGIYRVQADVDPRNDGSLRLLERLGFRREGELRGRYFQMGERQDAVILGLLAPEWPGR